MRYLTLMCITFLCGCASPTVNGNIQTVMIRTSPDGAKCRVLRDYQPLGEVSTPGSLQVTLDSPHPLNIYCDKDGYQMGRQDNPKNSTAKVFGNANGGLLGAAIASVSSGKYTDIMDIQLIKIND